MTPFWTSASFPENCCRGCQAASPGASQPWWNCSLAYRGVATIYYLGIVSIDIYSIYRYLQQHCVMAETHHSQLSAAREVGKNYQTLVNKFFSLRISNQDCVLCFVFFNTDITKLWCAITCFPQCDICGVCYIGSTGCWGLHLSQVPRTSRCLPSIVGRVASANIALLRLPWP